jgi:hypothetical protein
MIVFWVITLVSYIGIISGNMWCYDPEENSMELSPS